ncbi:MAG: hypothetical protein ACRDFX_14540 [Chloroflexota bacterium]
MLWTWRVVAVFIRKVYGQPGPVSDQPIDKLARLPFTIQQDMEAYVVRHRPRHIRFTIARRFEFERECRHCPPGLDGITARCPDCEALMMYRGLARLRNGVIVHHFECIHSPFEVHGVSIAVNDELA